MGSITYKQLSAKSSDFLDGIEADKSKCSLLIYQSYGCPICLAKLLPPKLQRRGLVFLVNWLLCSVCDVGYYGACVMGYYGA